jgi:hypothetical protein
VSSETLVLYLTKGGSAELRTYSPDGRLSRSATAGSVKHVRIELGDCSADVGLAEFEDAVVVRVSGRVEYSIRGSVVGVRCVGSEGKG